MLLLYCGYEVENNSSVVLVQTLFTQIAIEFH